MGSSLMLLKSMATNNASGLLDTNVLLRFVLGDVLEQVVAVDTLLAKKGVFEVADVAVIEMVYVLEKVLLFSREEVCEKVYGVIRNQQFLCNRKLFESVLPMYILEQKLSFNDCALATYAYINKSIPLYTFDKELAKRVDSAVLLKN